ncbi:MAG TPA: SUF system NifU family Fe-S cluster assembly protein [Caldithrix abyssi]|uniref:SUF system NifU family Fe-S cluster assembly protein n=1 Tax=Caldithrix abyssi TaxID=187145 RepID=A0A7V4U1X4_CALAY|nr:SUF system NifU family Fe-S cluster assembly protein [Caldithrix abyssi]
MDSEFRELYQEIIMDHNRKPRNFRKMEDATHRLDGMNPLCGDQYTIYLKVKDDIIEDVSFEGSGCAISKASASVMTNVLKGKTVQEAEKYFNFFHKMVTGEIDHPEEYLDTMGKLVAFAGVAEFPVRVKCATLPWHTMHNSLHGSQDKVTTEENN